MAVNLRHIAGSQCQGEGALGAIFSAPRCAEEASVLRNITCEPSKGIRNEGEKPASSLG